VKLVLFGDDFRLGVLKGDRVVDASAIGNEIPHLTPQQMMSGLIENFDQHSRRLEQLAGSSEGVPVSQVRLRAPLPRPARPARAAWTRAAAAERWWPSAT